jgi:hypothetical protein
MTTSLAQLSNKMCNIPLRLQSSQINSKNSISVLSIQALVIFSSLLTSLLDCPARDYVTQYRDHVANDREKKKFELLNRERSSIYHPSDYFFHFTRTYLEINANT